MLNSDFSGGKKGGGTNIGAIVGGVVGGVVGLVILGILLVFCLRRNRNGKKPDHSNVDLLNEDGSTGDHTNGNNANPPMIEQGFYHPEPFVVPEPGMSDSHGRPSNDRARPSFSTEAGVLAAAPESVNDSSADGRRAARNSQLSFGQTETSDPGSRRTRKSHPPAQMRPVNFIQHDDAGAVEAEPSAPAQEEVVELPPTYTSVPGAGNNNASTR